MIEIGDCRDIMRRWASEGVKAQTCVTSPPYFGLRDYGHPGQIGLEQTPEQYIAAMVEVFRCVRDVLADDGTLWLNIGDSYARAGGWSDNHGLDGVPRGESGRAITGISANGGKSQKLAAGCKPKDLIGIPWMLAFALRADGWYLRQDIIWHKPNPMPESVRDRCTKAHEYIFLMSKRERYFYDADVIREPIKPHAAKGLLESRDLTMSEKEQERARMAHEVWGSNQMSRPTHAMFQGYEKVKGANRRSVWTVATKPYSGAHFATYPPELIEPCILAGSRPGDTVLDPFMGSGTTAQVAQDLGRNAIGCELNPQYVSLQRERAAQLGLSFV